MTASNIAACIGKTMHKGLKAANKMDIVFGKRR